MHYFFLEKQSFFTGRWKLRQVAFDPKTRYLYISSTVSVTDIERAYQQLHTESSNQSPVSITWRYKIKVVGMHYQADDYIVPPSSADFNEKFLLMLTLKGYERALKLPLLPPSKRSSSLFSSFSLMRRGSRNQASSTGSYERVGLTEMEDNKEEFPSSELHVEGYLVDATVQEEMEDEDENMFRDIDLVPEDVENLSDEETSEEEDEESDVIHTPLSSVPSYTGSQNSGSSWAVQANPSACTAGKVREVVLRAQNYEAYRLFSLRVRTSLVRHGLCSPLHRGLPPYDPRNGIALATVPLHLRHSFRRLNDVVFYSFQIGHTVYLRNQREVRALNGYLCMTHDAVYLIQSDGKCPRWLDLEDIVGVDYVCRSSHSFVVILAKDPYPDFVFIPIFPTYPLCSTFDAEESVEGIVSMLRRLLIQRLRTGEVVSLAEPPKPYVSADDAEDNENYDILCHIHDKTSAFEDVFRYISLSGAGRPLRWKWDNSKQPPQFTFKRDLAEALQRDEDEDEDEAPELAKVSSTRSAAVAAGGSSASKPWRTSHANQLGHHDPMSASLAANGSLAATTTVAQLMAPPSTSAELRAIGRLKLTRTDPERRQQRTAVQGGRTSPAAGGAGGAGGAGLGGGNLLTSPNAASRTNTRTSSTGNVMDAQLGLPPRPSKPKSYGLVQRTPGPEVSPQMVAASRGTKLPIGTGSAESVLTPSVVAAHVGGDYGTDVSSDTTTSESDEEDDAFDSEDMDDLLESPREHSQSHSAGRPTPRSGTTGASGAHTSPRRHGGRRPPRRPLVQISDEEEEESSSEDEVPSPTLRVTQATASFLSVPLPPALTTPRTKNRS